MSSASLPPSLETAFHHAMALESGRLGPKLLALFAIALGAAMVIRAVRRRRDVWFHSRSTRKDLGDLRRQALHQLHLRRAHAALAELRRIDPRANPGAGIRYLRAVPGFVFEEMILLELTRRGLKCRRSERYTGDGGLDGEFRLSDQRWLVQAKCYSGPVRAEDIWHFNQLCAEHRALGLFIHTGKMAETVWRKAGMADRVVILSGPRLLEFFAGGGLDLQRRDPGEDRSARPMRAIAD